MRPEKGFTITELLITVAIFGIVAAIAAGSLGGITNTWRLQGAANDVAQAFLIARTEAIKRSVPTLVTFTGLGTSGSTVTVRADENRNDTADATDTVVKSFALNSHKGAFAVSVTGCNGAVTMVSFSPGGYIKLVNTGGVDRGGMPLVVVIDHTGATTPDFYQTIIDRSGSARVTYDYDQAAACEANTVVDDTSGGGSGPGKSDH